MMRGWMIAMANGFGVALSVLLVAMQLFYVVDGEFLHHAQTEVDSRPLVFL